MSALARLFWYDAQFDRLIRSKEVAVSEKQIDENRIERLGGLSTVRARAGKDQWSGADYAVGLSRTTVGSNTLSMNVARLPAGGTMGGSNIASVRG